MTGVPRRFLAFILGGESFALVLEQVAEVLDPPPLFPIPRVPSYFSGAINFHGGVVPVLDLAAYLKIDGATDVAKLLVLDANLASLALGVGPEVDILSESSILEEDEGDSPLMTKVLVTADRVIRLINPEVLIRELEDRLNG
jgi:purine-binding chemotaxis protein CheW